MTLFYFIQMNLKNIIIIMTFSCLLFGEKTYYVNGIVIDSKTLIGISDVNLYMPNLKSGVSTKDDGSFTLKINDTDDVAYRTFKERYIIGSPDLAIKKIREYQQALNPSEMICWMHMPGIPGADVINSMQLFAKEVMPAFS